MEGDRSAVGVEKVLLWESSRVIETVTCDTERPQEEMVRLLSSGGIV